MEIIFQVTPLLLGVALLNKMQLCDPALLERLGRCWVVCEIGVHIYACLESLVLA
jgi:hypothetical protein